MIKQIENIFQAGRIPKKKEEKVKIIVDNREKNSLVVACLHERGCEVEFKQLEIGDYILGEKQEIVVERKTFSDFVSSMINKRILTQLCEMKKYPMYFLILEKFDFNYHDYLANENAIRGMLLSVALKFKVPIIFTKDEEDSADFLMVVARRSKKPEKTDSALRFCPVRSSMSEKEQKQFILEGFEGIGPKTAKKLLKEFGSLKKIFSASREEIEKVLKSKSKKFLDILDN
jgi:Fanconi anemia group M protein